MYIGPIPTLAELLEHPEGVDQLPASACAALIIQAAAYEERHAALQLRLGVRLGVLAAPDAQGLADERLLTLPEVAAVLAVPKSEAYALARRGVLPTVRVGSKYVRMRRVDLEAWLRARRDGQLDTRLSQGYSRYRGDDGRGVPAAPAKTQPHPGRARRANGRALERRREVGAPGAADLGVGGAVPQAPDCDPGAAET
jgi:excisionase family DNA binding protein